MILLKAILIIVSFSLLATLLWIYRDFRKYRKTHIAALLFALTFPASLSAQYADADCLVSFKWHENSPGKLEQTIDQITYRFVPYENYWEIILQNHSDQEAKINWKNMQFIINGRTSEIALQPIAIEAEPVSTLPSQAEISRKVYATTYINNKMTRKIYDRKSIRKGTNAGITLMLPVGIGKRPQRFTSFSFIVTGQTEE